MSYVDKPCLCDEEPLDYTKVDKLLKNSVKTPYYKNAIIKKEEKFWYNNLESNVTPYQFFVLKTRLNYSINNNYDITFNSYQCKKKVQYILEVDNLTENNCTQLSPCETKKYQTLINNIICKYPNHCTLLHLHQDFLSTLPIKINKDNLITKIPKYYKTLINKNYNPILLENQLIIDLSKEIDYLTVYNQLQIDFINKLNTK